jgi:hypothetical protein
VTCGAKSLMALVPKPCEEIIHTILH